MAEPSPLEEDPGWPLGWRVFVGALYPMIASPGRRTRDSLVAMRQATLAYIGAIVLYVVFGLSLAGRGDLVSKPKVAAAFLLAGIAGYALLQWIGKPRLAGPSPTEVAAQYRTRFFLRAAAANLPALLGLVGHFMVRDWWLLPAATAVSLVAWRRVAPTRAAIAEDESRLHEDGMHYSLTQILRESPTS
ncbi:MAG: hypothetical protein Q8K63_16155 [Acidimicrobiales bacterium]|nr:hypothetical protein [Acidimicrobiales bacterium]